MAKFVVVLVLLSVQGSALGDELGDPRLPQTGPQQIATDYLQLPRAATESRFEANLSPADRGGLEIALMVFLGVGAIAFQLRRKYIASQRIWHRIGHPGAEPGRLEPRRRFEPPTVVRWQQTL